MIDEKVFILVKKAGLEFEKIANMLLEPHNLTNSQFKILLYLAIEDRKIKQVDIEKYYSMTNPTVTRIIDNLEKKGFVKRVKNKDDARSKIIVLTEKTQSKKDEIFKISNEFENRLTSHLTEREKENLISLLKKLLNKNI